MLGICRWITPPSWAIPSREHAENKVDSQSGYGCSGVQSGAAGQFGEDCK